MKVEDGTMRHAVLALLSASIIVLVYWLSEGLGPLTDPLLEQGLKSVLLAVTPPCRLPPRSQSTVRLDAPGPLPAKSPKMRGTDRQDPTSLSNILFPFKAGTI